MKTYILGGRQMRKFSFGLFGLLVVLGNRLGSIFGMAIAICTFMIVDGLIEEIQKRPRKTITKKKEEVK